MVMIAYKATLTTPVSNYAAFLTIFGLVQALSYLLVLSQQLVDLLEAVGVISNIRPSILGLTLFAYGNSVGGNLFLIRTGH